MVASTHPNILFIVDSGATSHTTPEGGDTFEADEPTLIELPDGNTITSIRLRTIPLEVDNTPLPPAATTALAVPGLTKNLLSVGQLCDIGCTAMFNRQTVTIKLGNTIILTGKRDRTTGLWMAPMPNKAVVQAPNCRPGPVQAYNVVRAPQADRISLLHAACFSPVISTWTEAIAKGHFAAWPGLTAKAVLRNPPKSLAMTKGHLNQIRKNLRSTRRRAPLPKPDTTTREQTKATDVMVEIVDAGQMRAKVYSDTTGQFLIPSSRGNRYLLIVYHYDSNFIFVEPMPSRTAEQILKAYQKVHQLLTARDMKPQLKIMDNEASIILKEYLRKENVTYQLVPPHVHRRNSAERAIQTFKDHFIAGLCSVDPDFPLHLWDQLLPQALITLNLMRTSRTDPTKSAYAQIYGEFDFNATPLGPPGCKIMTHEKPHTRGTWAPHATEGWYVGPALETYRGFTVYTPSTGAHRITDTLSWHPSNVIIPEETALAAAIAAIQDLTAALNRKSPFMAALEPSERDALRTVCSIFKDRFKTQHGQGEAPTGTDIGEEPRVTAAAIRPNGEEPRVIVEETRVTTVASIPNPQTSAPRKTSTRPTASDRNTSYANINHNPSQRRRRAKKAAKVATVAKDKAKAQAAANEATIRELDKATKQAKAAAKAKQLATDEGTTFRKSTPRRRPQSSKQPPATSTSDRPKRSGKVIHFDSKTHTRLINCVTTISAAANSAISISHRALLRGEHAEDWKRATTMEFGRLTQGMPGLVEGTNTMFFIPHSAKPADRKATYSRFVCDYNPAKAEPFRVRITAGGDQVEYPGEVSTPTVDISTVKCQFNSVLSTRDARYMTFDVSNFYLNTEMDIFEYMRIPVSAVPLDVFAHYQLESLVKDGFIMVEIRKGIYGLPQAGILANKLLVQRLAKGGYFPAPFTPGLFCHKTNGLNFTLWVDDFGVKYVHRKHVEHLLNLIKENYTIKEDWSGSKYLGLTLRWDYKRHTVDISMPGYIQRALQRFMHPTPKRAQHSPHSWTPPTYGSGAQYTEAPDESEPLEADDIKRLQQIIGVLLYYARMVDNTMLVAIGTIASAQAKGTKATMEAAIQLLNYAATHPNATVPYTNSDMTLHIISDASYLSASGARSRLGGYFFLGNKNTGTLPTDAPAKLNGPILVNSAIMGSVLASAGEAELGALFYNAKDGVMLRNTLKDLGHEQPATFIETDNACAAGIANDTIKQKRSKAIDMRFYWVRDRVRDGQFIVYWKKGAQNHADYFTKHFAPSHHRKQRSTYLHTDDEVQIVPDETIEREQINHCRVRFADPISNTK